MCLLFRDRFSSYRAIALYGAWLRLEFDVFRDSHEKDETQQYFDEGDSIDDACKR